MNFPFCNCGSVALLWDFSKDMSVNAPFPTSFKVECSTSYAMQMKCMVLTSQRKGTCAFCKEFQKHDEMFRKACARYILADSRTNNLRMDLNAKRKRLVAVEAALASYESETVAAWRKEYETKFGTDASGESPSKCSGHYTTTETAYCSGCWSSGYGPFGCNQPGGCQGKRYKQDHKDKCPKCMYHDLIVAPQKVLLNKQREIENAKYDVETAVASSEIEENELVAAESLAEMKQLWNNCYDWLEARLMVQNK